MIKCIIIEDQIPAQRILKRYITDSGLLQLEGTFIDALQASRFLKTNVIDLIFLDIHLPKISGLDFMEFIPLTPRPQIILTTAFSDYALKGYEFDVVDYLLKPYSFDRFMQAVEKADKILTLLRNQASSTTESLLVKEGHQYIKLIFQEIDYIKADNDYTKVCGKINYLFSYSLKEWLEKLPAHLFCRVHRSYIINITNIQKVMGSKIVINDTSVPIGRAFKKEFLQQYLAN